MCPDNYELRLCPKCNTFKNIPKGHTECMRCSFEAVKKMELK